mmetsp:Transcript_44101/g.68952  ORF Transcript_44101/g.68952 Transcript_44101/m.68952 type:complete len:253 (-) Transcript_44101:10-768(-)
MAELSLDRAPLIASSLVFEFLANGVVLSPGRILLGSILIGQVSPLRLSHLAKLSAADLQNFGALVRALSQLGGSPVSLCGVVGVSVVDILLEFVLFVFLHIEYSFVVELLHKYHLGLLLAACQTLGLVLRHNLSISHGPTPLNILLLPLELLPLLPIPLDPLQLPQPPLLVFLVLVAFIICIFPGPRLVASLSHLLLLFQLLSYEHPSLSFALLSSPSLSQFLSLVLRLDLLTLLNRSPRGFRDKDWFNQSP